MKNKIIALFEASKADSPFNPLGPISYFIIETSHSYISSENFP